MKPSDVNTAPIGEPTKTLRLQRRWSVRHAADLAGISHTQWSQIERGERSADNWFILAGNSRALRSRYPTSRGLCERVGIRW
ncbi:helix-turn-helix domain-containing protein [Catelliglobosispora koreensis]|uniref:helix-turn-helix domain-containing protein n=1 Tax=Catelliglobosispora koreensis TaxID=129052 RepID=UPI001FE23D8C|nr:helix-turn-helix transcriptional regulator [Catelliglobosispora koreensis]